jgi:hypothetical protein
MLGCAAQGTDEEGRDDKVRGFVGKGRGTKEQR